MSAHIRPCSRQNLRILSSILHSSRQEVGTLKPSPCRVVQRRIDGRCLASSAKRWATTRSTKKLKDLEQGSLTGPPLPQLEPEDAPQYPTTIQGARNNMIKFNKCLILTRVGNFYEVSCSRPVPQKRR